MKDRKDVSDLSDPEKERFVKALIDLKKSPSQVKNTGDYPQPKNRYDDYVYMHIINFGGRDANSMVAHQRPTFFPWHRIYLAKLERELQKLSPKYNEVTIPYWDWTSERSNGAVWGKDVMGGDGRESDGRVMDGEFAYDSKNWELYMAPNLGKDFDRPYLTRRLGFIETDGNVPPEKPQLPTSDDVLNALGIDLYDAPNWDTLVETSFRNYLEGFYGPGLHNWVHAWVGGVKRRTRENPPPRYEILYRGTMASGDSPNDPVFWLHHANIDRLWADWQLDEKHWNMDHKGYLPISNGPSGLNVNDAMPPWFGTSTPANAANFYSLEYKYKKYYRPNVVDRELSVSEATGERLVSREFLEKLQSEVLDFENVSVTSTRIAEVEEQFLSSVDNALASKSENIK
jgi:tyrosinase